MKVEKQKIPCQECVAWGDAEPAEFKIEIGDLEIHLCRQHLTTLATHIKSALK